MKKFLQRLLYISLILLIDAMYFYLLVYNHFLLDAFGYIIDSPLLFIFLVPLNTGIICGILEDKNINAVLLSGILSLSYVFYEIILNFNSQNLIFQKFGSQNSTGVLLFCMAQFFSGAAIAHYSFEGKIQILKKYLKKSEKTENSSHL